MRVTFNLPRPGGRRLAGTVALCSAASGLFLAPGLLGWPGTDLDAFLVTVGMLGPAGVGALTLTLLEQRVARDLTRIHWRPVPERDRAGVRR